MQTNKFDKFAAHNFSCITMDKRKLVGQLRATFVLEKPLKSNRKITPSIGCGPSTISWCGRSISSSWSCCGCCKQRSPDRFRIRRAHKTRPRDPETTTRIRIDHNHPMIANSSLRNRNNALGAVNVERTAIGARSFTSGARGTTMLMQHAAPGPSSERKSGLRRRSPQIREDFRPGRPRVYWRAAEE
jgi:hypothetical protein